jgi:hypothetical protein
MLVRHKSPSNIRHISLSFDKINILLDNDTLISAPLDFFPCLPNEKSNQRARWEALRWKAWQQLGQMRRDKREPKTLDSPESLPEEIGGNTQLPRNNTLAKTH